MECYWSFYFYYHGLEENFLGKTSWYPEILNQTETVRKRDWFVYDNAEDGVISNNHEPILASCVLPPPSPWFCKGSSRPRPVFLGQFNSILHVSFIVAVRMITHINWKELKKCLILTRVCRFTNEWLIILFCYIAT